MKKWFLLIAALGMVLALAACGDKKDDSSSETSEVEDKEVPEENAVDEENPTEEGELGEDDSASVTVDLINTDGNSVGIAELTEEEGGVRLKVNAQNLPEGPHGFHFHETGKCEAPNFESAGGHFNPTGASHGLDHEEGPHAGDLPNLEVREDGTVVDAEILVESVTLKEGEENSLLQAGGTALVIHADADDGTSQPSGDSGDRIVCGVIE